MTLSLGVSSRVILTVSLLLEQFHCYRPPPPIPTSAALCQAVPAISTLATTTSHDASDFDLYASIQSVTTSSYVPKFMRSPILQAAATRASVKPWSIPVSSEPRMSTHAFDTSNNTDTRHHTTRESHARPCSSFSLSTWTQEQKVTQVLDNDRQKVGTFECQHKTIRRLQHPITSHD